MEWLCLLFFVFPLGAFQEYDMDYIPPAHHAAAENRKKLVPPGYVMLSKEGTNNYFFVLNDEQVGMFIVDGKKLFFKMQNYTGNATNDPDWWHPYFDHRFPLCTCMDDFYEQPRPLLCYWYDDGPHIVIRECAGGITFHAFGKTHSETFNFDLNVEILAYDYVRKQIYAYEDGRIYKISPKQFIEIAKEKEISWDYVLEGNTTKVDTEWTDMLVVDDLIFYILGEHIYKYHTNGTSEVLAKTNSETFPYTLIPERTLELRETPVTKNDHSLLVLMFLIFCVSGAGYGFYKFLK